MPRHTGNITNGKAIELAETTKRALSLRLAGASLQAIADQLGLKGANRAHEIITRGIRAIPEPEALDLKRVERERLDRLMLAHWEKAIKGDPDATQNVLRVMARRAKLLGLDAPTKVDQTTKAVTILRWEDADDDAADADPDAPAPSGPAGGEEASGQVQGAGMRASLG